MSSISYQIDDVALPIDRVEVESSNCNVDVELMDVNFNYDDENKEKMKNHEMFKYKDLKNYSEINLYLKTDEVTHLKDHDIFKFNLSLKVYINKSELKDNAKVQISKAGTDFIIVDLLNGQIISNHVTEPKMDGNAISEQMDFLQNYRNKNTFKNEYFIDLAKTFKNEDSLMIMKDACEYIYNNFKYDSEHSTEAFLTAEDTRERSILKSKKGICLDFAELYNAVLSYYGIDSKVALVKGEDIFHAFNTVLLNGNKYSIDCTSGRFTQIE